MSELALVGGKLMRLRDVEEITREDAEKLAAELRDSLATIEAFLAPVSALTETPAEVPAVEQPAEQPAAPADAPAQPEQPSAEVPAVPETPAVQEQPAEQPAPVAPEVPAAPVETAPLQ